LADIFTLYLNSQI